MTIQASDNTPNRGTPRPLTKAGIATTATTIGDSSPRRFQMVLLASRRPLVKLGIGCAALTFGLAPANRAFQQCKSFPGDGSRIADFLRTPAGVGHGSRQAECYNSLQCPQQPGSHPQRMQKICGPELRRVPPKSVSLAWVM